MEDQVFGKTFGRLHPAALFVHRPHSPQSSSIRRSKEDEDPACQPKKSLPATKMARNADTLHLIFSFHSAPKCDLYLQLDGCDPPLCARSVLSLGCDLLGVKRRSFQADISTDSQLQQADTTLKLSVSENFFTLRTERKFVVTRYPGEHGQTKIESNFFKQGTN